ncbi:MAG TPA: hypothetical protein VGF86_14365 [Candidatus Tumulicola sp.]
MSNIFERDPEGIVEDERDALRRGKLIDDDSKRCRQLIGEQCGLVRAIVTVFPRRQCLRSNVASPEQIEAKPRCDGRQPCGHILDPGCIGTVEFDPRFLHHVLGIRLRSEEPRGKREQAEPLPLECCQVCHFISLTLSARQR